MLTIRLLGAPTIELAGESVHITRKKALGLLAYLAVRRQLTTREAAAALLWEDSDTARGLAYVRNAIWEINKAIGEEWLIVEDDTLLLAENADVDVTDFEALAHSSGHDDQQTQLDTLMQAVDLFRDDLLAGFSIPDSAAFEEWLYVTRESLRQVFTGTLERLCDVLVQLNRVEAAIPFARRLLEMDTLNEAAHRRLMQLYAWSGQFAAAHRQFQMATKILRDELGVDVDAQTEHLFSRIQARDLPPPTTVPQRITTANIAQASTQEAIAVRERLQVLPDPKTAFVGRGLELEEISAMLGDFDCHLLTLVGPGGAGKTRLAIEAGRATTTNNDLTAVFPDGVVFVPLAPVSSSLFIEDAIINALPTFEPGGDPHNSLMAYLADKALLIILDNFEHLMTGAESLPVILEHAPLCKLLITSRERLNLHEEWVFDTGGLDFPTSDSADWQDYGAVNLFVRSAQRNRRDFVLGDEDREAVIRICRMVDGMPLGIELAATWTRLLSCAEIANEIQNSLDFLTTSARNMPERHHSLRAVFEHSWGRLNTQEQALLRCLSPFLGAFSLDAAQTVAFASLPVMLSLVDKSLIRRDEDGMFQIHELIRQYAHEKMTDDERDQTLTRYISYYVDFLDRQLPLLKGDRQREAIDAIDEVISNVREAWQKAIDLQRWHDLQKMMEPLMWKNVIMDYRKQQLGILAQCALEALPENPDDEFLRTLRGVIIALYVFGFRHVMHQRDVDTYTDQSIALLDSVPDSYDILPALALLSWSMVVPGRPFEQSCALIERGYRIAEEQQDDIWLADFYYLEGASLQNDIRYREVEKPLQKAVDLFKEHDNAWGIAISLEKMADNMITMGYYDRARELDRQALSQIERLGDHWWIAFLDKGLSKYEQGFHNLEETINVLKGSIDFFKENGDKMGYAGSMYHLAWMHLVNDQTQSALDYFQTAQQLFAELGADGDVAWSMIFRGIARLKQGDTGDAYHLADEAVKTVAHLRHPWVVSAAHHLKGDVFLARGELAVAYAHQYHAVKIAYEADSVLQVLRHLTGLAEVLLGMGREDEGLHLLVYNQDHPVTGLDSRLRIRAILETYTPDQLAPYEVDPESVSLDEVVASLPEPSEHIERLG